MIQVKKHPARHAALYLSACALSLLVSCTNPWMDSIVDKILKEDKPGGGPSGSGTLIFYPSTPAEWDGALAAINGGGSNKAYVIMVTGNLAVSGTTGSSTFPPGSNVSVRGNGSQTISLDSNGSLFRVDSGQTLTINNVTVEGHAGNNAPAIYTEGTVELNGSAQIKNNEYAGSNNGGGVYVSGSNGNLTMKDESSIITNTAGANGGGVYVNGGNFTMQDRAYISGNKANNAGYGGGGVYVENGNFIMEGYASIYGNNAKNDGAGVFLHNSPFIMRGNASIHDNVAYVDSDGHDGNGGGLYAFLQNSVVTMQDNAVIYNNTGKKGGGVFVNSQYSQFTMEGNARIRNNTAAEYGGGVSIDAGEFTMSGGIISGNMAPRGGGVHINTRVSAPNILFKKETGGGIIYGSNDPALMNQATDGHVAYYGGDTGNKYYRDDTLGAADNISTDILPTTATGAYDSTNWIKKP